MSKVFLDTNIFIYLIEGAEPARSQVLHMLARLSVRGDQLITSHFTLAELLVKPIELRDHDLVDTYRKVLTRFKMIAFDENCVDHYASIRIDRSIRHADAIQLACAASAQIDLFVTNDLTITSKIIPGINFIVPLDRVPV